MLSSHLRCSFEKEHENECPLSAHNIEVEEDHCSLPTCNLEEEEELPTHNFDDVNEQCSPPIPILRRNLVDAHCPC